MKQASNLHLEDYLSKRRNHILSLWNAHHSNQREINKHLFALAVVGFGYNLTIFDTLKTGWSFLLWFLTASSLMLTVISGFFVFSHTSETQIFIIQLTEMEFLQDQNNDEILETNLENKISSLNDFKYLSFITFVLSMIFILTQFTITNYR